VVAGHLNLGRRGEEAAERFLSGLGYEVLDRNWRCRWGELDLVCTKGRTVVFVEVKTRKCEGLTSPAEALTPDKRARIAAAARAYLSARKLWERPCRFDLILAVGGDERLELEHVTDAFDLSATLGGGHSAWQPW
jgi:putative endonuclease